MSGRTSFYGGIVSDGLVFHIDAAKQESYAKTGIRYWQQGAGSLVVDFADESIWPSPNTANGSVINGATFSNFAPYHRAGYKTIFWHDPSAAHWKQSANAGTYYGNIELNGANQHILFSSTPELTGITDITVSAWVYINRFTPGISPTGGTFGMIASRYAAPAQGGTPANGWELFYDNSGVVIFGGREVADVGATNNYIYVTASSLVQQSNMAGLTSNGGWYNIVGTKQGNIWKAYVAETNRSIDYGITIGLDEGAKLVSTSAVKHATASSTQKGTGTTPFGTNPLYLGRNAANAIYQMNGRIMQLSIYNRALSLSEINQNFDAFSKRIEKVPEAFSQGVNSLREYEYMIVTYVYSSDGIQRDLDSATFFQGTGTVEDTKKVGCGQGAYATPIDPGYILDPITNDLIGWKGMTSSYLRQTGDDVANGKGESILINFENMKKDMPTSSINNNVSVELYGGWHSNSTLAQGAGYLGNWVKVDVSTYVGGNLTNPASAPNTILSSGSLIQRFTYDFPVIGSGVLDQGCGQNPVTNKTRVGTINYNLLTRISTITFY